MLEHSHTFPVATDRLLAHEEELAFRDFDDLGGVGIVLGWRAMMSDCRAREGAEGRLTPDLSEHCPTDPVSSTQATAMARETAALTIAEDIHGWWWLYRAECKSVSRFCERV